MRWSITAPAPVHGARWSLEPTVPPCCRVAYLTGGTLRIVAGDGSGDHELAPADRRAAPAWRPGDHRRALAYVDPAGAVRLVAADTGEALASPYHRGFRPTLLAWSSDGRRLLAMNPVRLVVLDASLRPIGATGVRRRPAGPSRRRVRAAQPRADRAAPARSGDAHRMELLRPGTPPRVARDALGGLTGLAPSPDGRNVLVGWGAADQWLLVPTRGGRRAG